MRFTTYTGSIYQVNRKDKVFCRQNSAGQATEEWKKYSEFFCWAEVANGNADVIRVGQPAVFVYDSKDPGGTILTTSAVLSIEEDKEESETSDLTMTL